MRAEGRAGRTLVSLVVAATVVACSPVAPSPSSSSRRATDSPGPALTTSPAPTTSAPASAPSPSASPAAPGWTWATVDASQFGEDPPSLFVDLPDGRLLGFSDQLISDAERPTLWVSADGIVWSRHESPAFRPPRKDCSVYVNDVARTPAGLAAVGRLWCNRGGGSVRAVAWTSADGLTWRAATVGDASWHPMAELVVTDHGLVALGEPDYDIGAGFQDLGTAEWTSADGRSWRRVARRAEPPTGVNIGGVVEFRSAYYAMGSGDDRPDRGPSLWRSAAAVHWKPVRGSPRWVSDIAVAGERLVAVGQGPTDVEQAVVWTTEDGSTWSRPITLPDPVIPARGPGQRSPAPLDDVGGGFDVHAVMTLPDGTLVAEGIRSDFGLWDSVLWSSPDGTAWRAVPLPVESGYGIDGIGVASSGLFVVGDNGFIVGDNGGDQILMAALLGTPPSP